MSHQASLSINQPQRDTFLLGLIHHPLPWDILTHFACLAPQSLCVSLQSCRSGHRKGSRSATASSGQLCPTFGSWPHQKGFISANVGKKTVSLTCNKLPAQHNISTKPSQQVWTLLKHPFTLTTICVWGTFTVWSWVECWVCLAQVLVILFYGLNFPQIKLQVKEINTEFCNSATIKTGAYMNPKATRLMIVESESGVF